MREREYDGDDCEHDAPMDRPRVGGATPFPHRLRRETHIETIASPIIEVRPNQIITVPGLGAIPPGDDQPGRCEFRTTRTIILGIRGSSRNDTVGSEAAGAYEQASMAFQMMLEGGLQLITNGRTADFVRYSDLFPDTSQFLPFWLELPPASIMSFIFRNLQPVATGDDLTPSLAFQCHVCDGCRICR